MYEFVIDKIESSKCKNKKPLSGSLIEESDNNVLIEVKPISESTKPQIKLAISTSTSLKDKIEKLKLASHVVKKPMYAESKKISKIVELW